jgi:hypothetical protein
MVNRQIISNFIAYRIIPFYFLSGILIAVLDMGIIYIIDPNNELFQIYSPLTLLFILVFFWPIFDLAIGFEWIGSLYNFTSSLRGFTITILNFIIPIITYFIIRKISLPQEKLVKRLGAPDFETALKIEKLDFKSYNQYLEAKKRKAENYIQYQITEKYQVDNYPLAFKIASGKFPDYDIYKQALQEGFSFYDEWKEKEERKANLVKIMKRANSIHRDDFMAFLGFSNNKRFVDWIMSLPEGNPFVISGDLIKFRVRKGDLIEDIEKI